MTDGEKRRALIQALGEVLAATLALVESFDADDDTEPDELARAVDALRRVLLLAKSWTPLAKTVSDLPRLRVVAGR